MKNIRWVILPLCAFVTLSCGKKTDENDDGLTFTTSSKVILLDADIYSCDDLANSSTTPSLKAVAGKTGAVKIQWSGANDLEIQKATLVVRSGSLEGGEFKVDFIAEGMVYPGGDPDTVHTVSCGFRFGSVNLKDKNRSAFMSGTVTMVGITTDSEDNTSAVKATYDIDFQYDP